MTWTGIGEFTRFLNETPGIVVKDLEAALLQEAENVMGVSKRRTPVDTGNLRATGHVKNPETHGGITSVVLAYGTDYAVHVHERPARHPSGRSKYLQSAVEDNAKGMSGRLRKRVLARIGKRGL